MLSLMPCVRSRFTWWWLGISKEKDTERGFHNAIDTTTKGQYPKEEGEGGTTEEHQYQKGRVNNQPEELRTQPNINCAPKAVRDNQQGANQYVEITLKRLADNGKDPPQDVEEEQRSSGNAIIKANNLKAVTVVYGGRERREG